MASRWTAATAYCCSVRSVLRNLSRAGVAKNRSRTSTRVPWAMPSGLGMSTSPPETVSAQPLAAPGRRLATVIRLTAPIEGSASPRKPRVRMSTRSSSTSFDVAWRSTARASSSRLMPQPSSATWIRLRPPSRTITSMRVAPASMAFSTSSLTAAAGRSMTSPAAIRFTRFCGRSLIAIYIM